MHHPGTSLIKVPFVTGGTRNVHLVKYDLAAERMKGAMERNCAVQAENWQVMSLSRRRALVEGMKWQHCEHGKGRPV